MFQVEHKSTRGAKRMWSAISKPFAILNLQVKSLVGMDRLNARGMPIAVVEH